MTTHPLDALSAYLDDDLDAAARAAVDAPPGRRARRAAPWSPTCSGCAADAAPGRRRHRHAVGAICGRASRRASASEPRRRPGTGAARCRPRGTSAAGRWACRTGRRRHARRRGHRAALLWRGAPGAAPAPAAGPAPVLAEVEPVDAPDGAVTTVSFADAQYDAAVADLERVLREQRDRLEPAHRASCSNATCASSTTPSAKRATALDDRPGQRAAQRAPGRRPPAQAAICCAAPRSSPKETDAHVRSPSARVVSLLRPPLLPAATCRRRPAPQATPAAPPAATPQAPVQARPGGPETRDAAHRPDRGRGQGHAARAVEPGRRSRPCARGIATPCACRRQPRRARARRRADRRQHAARARTASGRAARPGSSTTPSPCRAGCR